MFCLSINFGYRISVHEITCSSESARIIYLSSGSSVFHAEVFSLWMYLFLLVPLSYEPLNRYSFCEGANVYNYTSVYVYKNTRLLFRYVITPQR